MICIHTGCEVCILQVAAIYLEPGTVLELSWRCSKLSWSCGGLGPWCASSSLPRSTGWLPEPRLPGHHGLSSKCSSKGTLRTKIPSCMDWVSATMRWASVMWHPTQWTWLSQQRRACLQNLSISFLSASLRPLLFKSSSWTASTLIFAWFVNCCVRYFHLTIYRDTDSQRMVGEGQPLFLYFSK